MGNSDDPHSTTTIQLLSTQQLRTLLDNDAATTSALQAAADGDLNGVLGIDEQGQVEVLEKSSLDALMSDSYVPEPRRQSPPRQRADENFGFHEPKATSARTPAPDQAEEPVRRIEMPADNSDDLELVDTRMLRVILDEQRVAEGKQPMYDVPDPDDGNPYNTAPRRK